MVKTKNTIMLIVCVVSHMHHVCIAFHLELILLMLFAFYRTHFAISGPQG
jgi:hypothetical protein